MRKKSPLPDGSSWMRQIVKAVRAHHAAPAESPTAPAESPTAPATSPTAPATSPTAPATSPTAPATSPIAPHIALDEVPGGLFGCLERIRRLFTGMGAAELQPADRQRLGGMIFAGCDIYVRGVARGLCERPDLFDVPGVDGEELARRQQRARAWFWVRAALLRMAGDAGDSYLLEQGLAIEEANRVIETVRNEAEARMLRGEQGPDEQLRLLEQQAALFEALWVMDRRAEAKKRARRNSAKKVAEAQKQEAKRARRGRP